MSEGARGAGVLVARLHALWRGTELAGEAGATADADAVRLALRTPRAQLLVLPYETLDGVTWDGTTLALHEARGDVLELTGDAVLGALAARIEAAACTLPEQTLALRGFASERSAPGSDHDAWFAALLAARRACAAERTVAGQVAAFDAPALARHARATWAAWAEARVAAPGPDRRALQYELEELGEEYTAALATLGAAARQVVEGDADRRFAAFRGWTQAVTRAFRAADATWIAAVPVLCDPRGAEGRLWRRVLRREGER